MFFTGLRCRFSKRKGLLRRFHARANKDSEYGREAHKTTKPYPKRDPNSANVKNVPKCP